MTITNIIYDDQREEKTYHTYVNLGTLENSQRGQEFLTGWTIDYGTNSEGKFRLLKQGRHIYSHLAWQEEIDNAGRKVIHYDGDINPNNGEFERERISESIFNGVLGMVNIAERGNTYIYMTKTQKIIRANYS